MCCQQDLVVALTRQKALAVRQRARSQSTLDDDLVRPILERFEPRMDSIWQEVLPRFETLRGELRSDINAQLTPEQQRHYAELLERHDARRRNSKDSANAPH